MYRTCPKCQGIDDSLHISKYVPEPGLCINCFRETEMLAVRARLMRKNPHVTTAAEFAPLMGEYEGDYWNWQLKNLFESEQV